MYGVGWEQWLVSDHHIDGILCFKLSCHGDIAHIDFQSFSALLNTGKGPGISHLVTPVSYFDDFNVEINSIIRFITMI